MADPTILVGRLIVTGAVEYPDATEQTTAAADATTVAELVAPLDAVFATDAAVAEVAARVAALEGAAETGGAGTALVSGGAVVHLTGLQLRVAAGVGRVAGVEFAAAEQTVTLSAADATFDRIDVVAWDAAGAALVIAGTPAASPVKPAADPALYVELTHVDVAAGATAPGNITTVVVFREGAGGEWAPTTVGTGWATAATADPHAGTVHVEATNVKSGQLRFTNPGTSDLSGASLSLFLKPVSALPRSRTITLSWLDGAGAQAGAAVTLTDGAYGLAFGTLSYQLLAFPPTAFALPAGSAVKTLLVDVKGSGGGVFLRLDDVTVQSGAAPPAAPQSTGPATADVLGTVKTDATVASPVVYLASSVDTLLANKATAASVTAEASARSAADAALGGRLDVAEATLTDHESRITSLETTGLPSGHYEPGVADYGSGPELIFTSTDILMVWVED